jgi:hypothetical protein
VTTDQSPQRARIILRVTAAAGPDEVEAVIPAWAPDRPVRLPATSFGLRPGDRLSALIGRRWWVTADLRAATPEDLGVTDITPASGPFGLPEVPEGTRFVDGHRVSVWCKDLGAAVPMTPPTGTDNSGPAEWTIAVLPPHGTVTPPIACMAATPAERAAQTIHDQLHTVVEHGSSCWCCCLFPPCREVRDALHEHDQRTDGTDDAGEGTGG